MRKAAINVYQSHNAQASLSQGSTGAKDLREASEHLVSNNGVVPKFRDS